MHYRIIFTVGEQVQSQNIAGGQLPIRINKPTHGGVIVAGLEVVQQGFAIIDISAVAQRVIGAQCRGQAAGGRQQFAPGIIAVPDNLCATAIQDCNYVALQICCVVIGGTIVNHRHGMPVGIVVEMQGVAANGHMGQLAVVVEIVVGGCAVGTLGTHAIGIVSEVPGGAALGHAGKLPAVDPCIVPCAVIGRVADGVVGDGSAVIRSQQITPLCVTIAIINRALSSAKGSGGVGVFPLAENITRIVVCPHPRLACGLVVLPDQLIGTVSIFAFMVAGIATRYPREVCAIADTSFHC